MSPAFRAPRPSPVGAGTIRPDSNEEGGVGASAFNTVTLSFWFWSDTGASDATALTGERGVRLPERALSPTAMTPRPSSRTDSKFKPQLDMDPCASVPSDIDASASSSSRFMLGGGNATTPRRQRSSSTAWGRAEEHNRHRVGRTRQRSSKHSVDNWPQRRAPVRSRSAS